jgi:hypothetical protein
MFKIGDKVIHDSYWLYGTVTGIDTDSVEDEAQYDVIFDNEGGFGTYFESELRLFKKETTVIKFKVWLTEDGIKSAQDVEVFGNPERLGYGDYRNAAIQFCDNYNEVPTDLDDYPILVTVQAEGINNLETIEIGATLDFFEVGI